MKTIYMDVTGFLAFPGITGIQRVVGEVASRLIAAQKNQEYQVVLLRHNRDFHFSICDNDRFFSYYRHTRENKNACVTARFITIDGLDENAFWLDVDGVWTSMIPRHLLYPQLAKRNVQIGVYVHDVIAITHPYYVAADSHMRFPPFLGSVFDYANIIFTNTEFTKQQIQNLARELHCTRDIQYVLAVPGGDFTEVKTAAHGGTQILPQVQQIVDQGNILMMVSTLEIRKNHQVLLDAFDQGLAQMGYQLVFVGKKGWKVDALLERIEAHPENGKHLFHLTGLDDDNLHYLYQNASFILFSSYIEGFGLATVEAMQYGIPTILSDVPVMHEVGGEYCDYFSPDDPQQLIDILSHYQKHPEEYQKKREQLAQYRCPTWNACVRSIIETVMNFRRAPEDSHTVEQIVYLAARSDGLLQTLEYVERFMPFLRKVLLFCPAGMAQEMKQLYHGRLALTCVTDDELLQGRALPEDHAYRNYFLRCLAMQRPELEEEFIMSDDDYRPLQRVELSFFIREGRYQAFYFYDLDQWENVVRTPTSYDKGMKRTNQFLKAHGYPNLQYAAHMPQIIRKSWFLEMLQEHPGLETQGLCEWATYFNYSIAKHPEAFDVRPYVTLAWPELATSWRQMVVPNAYWFENFYPWQYEKNRYFAGMKPEYSDDTYLENMSKKLIFRRLAQESLEIQQRWREFENRYSVLYKLFPSFVFCYGYETTPGYVNLPRFLELDPKGIYDLAAFIVRRTDSGMWEMSDEEIWLGCRWAGNSQTMTAFNLNRTGKVIFKVLTPAQAGKMTLELLFSLDGQNWNLNGQIPVEIREKGC